MSATLTLRAVTASYGARPLFHDLDLTLAAGQVIGVVGLNGAGKSTVLRIATGRHTPDSGDVRLRPAQATTGFLAQEAPRSEESLFDFALRRTGVAAATTELEASTEALSRQEDGAEDRYAVALERWLGLGGADLDHRLPTIAAQVGLDVDVTRPLGSLSGGQTARAGLVTVLASSFDVLVLDEPTNDLDADGQRLITDFIAARDTPVLIASHDRTLLDAVATEVIELDIAQDAIRHVRGGWSDLQETRALERRHAVEDYERHVEHRQALTQRADQRSEWGAQGARAVRTSGEGDKHIRHKKTTRAQAQDAKGAQVRRALERLPDVAQPRKEWQLRYAIAEAQPPVEVVVSLVGAVVRQGLFTLGPLDVTLTRGDRVGLLGRNGSGKSTLLGAVTGELPLVEGRRQEGARVRWGLVDQRRQAVSGERPLADVVRDLLTRDEANPEAWPPAQVRTLLAKFGLGAEHVDRACSSLSVGERTRAMLAVMQGSPVNVVVLDEPTNHLDIEALEQVEAALAAFTGTLVVVSHDERLLAGIGLTHRWTLADGTLTRLEV